MAFNVEDIAVIAEPSVEWEANIVHIGREHLLREVQSTIVDAFLKIAPSRDRRRPFRLIDFAEDFNEAFGGHIEGFIRLRDTMFPSPDSEKIDETLREKITKIDPDARLTYNAAIRRFVQGTKLQTVGETRGAFQNQRFTREYHDGVGPATYTFMENGFRPRFSR